MSGVGLEAVAIWGAWGIAGAALAGLNLALLRRSVAALASGEGPWRAGLSMALRLALAGAVLWLAAQQGAAPLLFAAAGYLATRAVILRRVTGGGT